VSQSLDRGAAAAAPARAPIPPPENPLRRRFRRGLQLIGELVRFLLAGLPAFLVAIALNYTLVTWARLPKPLAYGIALACQIALNFVICREFVFQAAPGASFVRQFTGFVAGIGLFRVLDWAVYSAAVEFLGVPYLAAQLMNVVVFSLPKYKYLEQVFQNAPRGSAGGRTGHP
jgi:putative flippase GtrA